MSSKKAYRRYLNSSHWKSLRKKVLKRAKNTCEKKGCDREAKHVHHKTYKRLGKEKLKDLEALCIVCHQREHPEKEIIPGWNEEDDWKNEDRWTHPVTTEFNCPFCPSMLADFYLTDIQKLFICHSCGHSEKQYRAWKLSKMKKARRQKNPTERSQPLTERTCSECGDTFETLYACKQHLWDKHGIKAEIKKEERQRYMERYSCPFCDEETIGILDHLKDSHQKTFSPEELADTYGIEIYHDRLVEMGFSPS